MIKCMYLCSSFLRYVDYHVEVWIKLSQGCGYICNVASQRRRCLILCVCVCVEGGGGCRRDKGGGVSIYISLQKRNCHYYILSLTVCYCWFNQKSRWVERGNAFFSHIIDLSARCHQLCDNASHCTCLLVCNKHDKVFVGMTILFLLWYI